MRTGDAVPGVVGHLVATLGKGDIDVDPLLPVRRHHKKKKCKNN
jgi:hypothetical protein